jgi:hypothetical protein
MENMKTAADFYKQQHDRWNHWAVFFFGLIASVYVIRNYNQELIPAWFAHLTAMAISIVWVWVALNIRASTFAWLQVRKRLEELPDANRETIRIFHEHEAEFSKYDRLDDLLGTMAVWNGKTSHSVTRLITIVSVFMVGVFMVMFFLALGTFGTSQDAKVGMSLSDVLALEPVMDFGFQLSRAG